MWFDPFRCCIKWEYLQLFEDAVKCFSVLSFHTFVKNMIHILQLRQYIYIAWPTNGRGTCDTAALFCQTGHQRDVWKQYVMLFSMKWFVFFWKLRLIEHLRPAPLPLPSVYVQPVTPDMVGGEQHSQMGSMPCWRSPENPPPLSPCEDTLRRRLFMNQNVVITRSLVCQCFGLPNLRTE